MAETFCLAVSLLGQTGIDIGYMTDASGGRHLVTISEKPQGEMVPALCGSSPCFVELPGPIPIQPLTAGQKQLLNGFPSSSNASIPVVTLPVPQFPKTAPISIAPLRTPDSSAAQGQTGSDSSLPSASRSPIQQMPTEKTAWQAFADGFSRGMHEQQAHREQLRHEQKGRRMTPRSHATLEISHSARWTKSDLCGVKASTECNSPRI